MKMRRRVRTFCMMLILTTFCMVQKLSLGMHAQESASRSFFFFVITDIQLGMFDHDQDLTRESENLEQFVEAANRLHPAFIVNCGDIVNKAGNPVEIQRYQTIMAKLNPQIPVYHVPGNHDLRNQPTPDSIAAFRQTFGRDYYTFQYQGFEGIVLDTSLIKDSALVPHEAEAQAKWLEKTLSEVRERKGNSIVVFQHIPWFLHEADEPDNYSNMPKSMRGQYLANFKKAHVHHVFAGHLHDEALGRAEGIESRTVGPLGKPLGKAESGFGLVVVEGEKIKFTYYPISAPPTEPPI